MAGDTFTESMFRGLELGFQLDAKQRYDEALRIQQEHWELTKQALQQQQMQQQGMRQAFQDVQQPSSFVPAQVQDKYGLTTPGAVQELIPGQTTRTPARISALSMFPTQFSPLVNKLLDSGMSIEDIGAHILKLPVEPKYMNVAPGGTVIEPSTGRQVFSAAPKEQAPIGLDPQTMVPVYRHPRSGMTFTMDETGQQKPYRIISQLKTVTEPAPLFQITPGYQTPQGQPVPFSMRTGRPTIGGELQKTPSESDVAAARTKTTIDAVMDEIDNAFKAAEKSLPKNAQERVTGYPGRVAAVKLQTDPALVLADSLANGFMAKFARFAGEVGVLTDKDLERAKPLSYSIHDTKEVRAKKKQGIMALANEIYERGKRQQNPLGNAQDSNVPGFDATIEKSGGKIDYDYVPGKGLVKR